MPRNFLSKMAVRIGRKAQGLPKNINLDKTDLIDYTFERCHPVPASFADLGGVWGVNGAYTSYILDRYDIRSASLADTNFTAAVKKMAGRHKNLKLIHGNFGESKVRSEIGQVDAVLMFDVLLHQVNPDWDEILKSYSKQTNYLIVYNQQWIGSEKSLRLVDLGREEYLKNVPREKNESNYNALFERMYEIHPEHNRIWRDIHNVWQWGITDSDLLSTVAQCGYKLRYYKNCGRFGSLQNFENHAFVFEKTRS